jgi:hypothetical protein
MSCARYVTSKGKGLTYAGTVGRHLHSSNLFAISVLESGCGVVIITPRRLYSQERDPVPLVQRTGWAPGPVWTGAKNLAPTGIRSPDRRAYSELLRRYAEPMCLAKTLNNRRFSRRLF